MEERLLDGDGGRPSPWTRFWFQFSVVHVLDIHAFLIGFSSSFTSPTLSQIISDLELCSDSDDDGVCDTGSWVASAINITALLGALLAGRFADSFGRKRALLVVSLPWTVGYTLIGSSYLLRHSPHQAMVMLLSGRAVTGLAVGMASSIIPCFVAEMAAREYRGVLLALMNLNISWGILAIAVLGIWVERIDGWWSVMGFFAAFLGALVALVVSRVPESPTFLARHGNQQEAIAALRWFHGDTLDAEAEASVLAQSGHADAAPAAYAAFPIRTQMRRQMTDQEDLSSLAAAARDAETAESKDVAEVSPPSALRPASLGIFIVAAFALSGQKMILAFLNQIFISAGADPIVGSIGYGLAQVVVSVLGMKYLVPNFGRVTLLVTSLVGNCFSMGALGLSFLLDSQGFAQQKHWLPILALVSFISFTAVGLGPLSWAYSSEICPKHIRGQVSGVALFTFWSLSFVETQFFEVLIKTLTETGLFFAFAVICAVNGIIFRFIGAETQGLTLAQVEARFSQQQKQAQEPLRYK